MTSYINCLFENINGFILVLDFKYSNICFLSLNIISATSFLSSCNSTSTLVAFSITWNAVNI